MCPRACPRGKRQTDLPCINLQVIKHLQARKLELLQRLATWRPGEGQTLMVGGAVMGANTSWQSPQQRRQSICSFSHRPGGARTGVGVTTSASTEPSIAEEGADSLQSVQMWPHLCLLVLTTQLLTSSWGIFLTHCAESACCSEIQLNTGAGKWTDRWAQTSGHTVKIHGWREAVIIMIIIMTARSAC